MIKISDKDRELLGKLGCEKDFWNFLEEQFLKEHEITIDYPSYWPKKSGYLTGRLRGLLAAIRAHEETE